MVGDQKIVVFRLGEGNYGISMENVISIEKISAIMSVPQTKDYIAGIVKLREDVIPVFDLRKYLLTDVTDHHEESRMIVVKKSDDTVVGLIVDEAKDIIDIKPSTIEAVPIQAMKIDGDLKVVKTDEQLIILIEIEQLLRNKEVIQALDEVTKVEDNVIPQ